jgi:hypothetical protein
MRDVNAVEYVVDDADVVTRRWLWLWDQLGQTPQWEMFARAVTVTDIQTFKQALRIRRGRVLHTTTDSGEYDDCADVRASSTRVGRN